MPACLPLPLTFTCICTNKYLHSFIAHIVESYSCIISIVLWCQLIEHVERSWKSNRSLRSGQGCLSKKFLVVDSTIRNRKNREKFAIGRENNCKLTFGLLSSQRSKPTGWRLPRGKRWWEQVRTLISMKNSTVKNTGNFYFKTLLFLLNFLDNFHSYPIVLS